MLQLKPLQIETLKNWNYSKRYLIANAMRAGKTITALKCLEKTMDNNIWEYPCLIIVKKSLMYQWYYEFHKVFGYYPIIVNEQKEHDRYKDTSIPWIISFDRFQRDYNTILKNLKYHFVIIDEIHLRSGRNKTKKDQKHSTFFDACVGVNKRAEYLLVLTATPAKNDPEKFYIILNLLDNELFKSYWNYVSVYCKTQKVYTKQRNTINKVVGFHPQTGLELQKWLGCNIVNGKMSRYEIPTNEILFNEIILNIEATKQQKHIYNKLLKEKEFHMNNEYLSLFSKAPMLSLLNYTVRINSLPEQYGIEGAKVKLVKEILANEILEVPVDKKTKFIFVVRHINSLNEYATLIPNCGIIYGNIKLQDRETIKNDFNSNKIQHLICQMDTLNAGLTLNGATGIVFIDLPWNNTDYDQICGRIREWDPPRTKDVYVIMTDMGVDKWLWDMIQKKESALAVINNIKDFNETFFIE